MANNRVYYAIQQVSFGKHSGGSSRTMKAVHGVQSVGITTTFNLEQIFELGQLAIYENIEGTPDIEVTLSKVLDGYMPLFCLATADETAGPQLNKRALARCFVQLGIWEESFESAGESSADPTTWVEMSGLYISSVSYNFPLDDNFSEDVTLVGNYKVWGAGQNVNTNCADGGSVSYTPSLVDGAFAGNNDAPVGSGGVNRRQNIIFATTDPQTGNPDYTIVPQDIPGVGEGGQKGTAHISSISVSTDVGREDLFELGKMTPYAKTTTFPLEVTCDIEITTVSGDLINAVDECTGAGDCKEAGNLSDMPIRIATCEGLRIWLGTKNKLSSVSYGGGDAGGGNATVTYSYSTFNDFVVQHEAETGKAGVGASTSGEAWWSARSTYLNP